MFGSTGWERNGTIDDDRTRPLPAQKAVELFDREHPRPHAPAAPDGHEAPLEFRLANRAGGREAAVRGSFPRRQYAACAENELRPDAVHDGGDDLPRRGLTFVLDHDEGRVFVRGLLEQG
jgi:hypothetical protein